MNERLGLLLTCVAATAHCAGAVAVETAPAADDAPAEAVPSGTVHQPATEPASVVDACIPPDDDFVRGSCGTLALGGTAAVSHEEGERMMAVAEAHYEANRWPECAEHFGITARHHPDRARAAEAAYAAVLCHTNRAGWNERRPAPQPGGDGAFVPRPFDENEQQFLRAAELFLCLAPDSEDFVPVAYRRARVYYQSNHFHRAALLLRQIAMHHTTNELAEFAANLYLDCVNVLAREQERRISCRAALTEETNRLYRLFQCSDTSNVSSAPELCYSLEQIRCAARRRQAEQLAEQGDLVEAGDIYMDLFHSGRDCGGRTEDLSNARLLFERAGHAERAAEARELLRQRLH